MFSIIVPVWMLAFMLSSASLFVSLIERLAR